MLDAPAMPQAQHFSSIIYNGSRTHLIAKLADHELWMAFFRDPHDNLLALMTEVRE